ncbi:LptE family protein [Croceivirga sp. JEA036]|uniref:LptE family protein n=1 Tax=Croceivirga sp. JEA036 TaxID=2721162 RepID=UPI00143A9665|nr:LptE family protein [Croceivirga sp. JEA036]NJB36657.1 LptE family protein [Croceivirga sp. JEA036]
MKLIKSFFRILSFVGLLTIQACGFYNFSGASTGTAETVQVNFFQNYADQTPGSTIEPGLDRDFTNALQDLITNLTSLNLTSNGGDLLYEGEIVEYRVSPMSATANQQASQNRLTISVNVRFYNKTKEDADFERRFSFFYDYPQASLLQNVKTEAHEVIFERITQDIFNASLADW